MKKQIALIMVAFLLALTGCASVEPDQEKAPVPTEMTISVENPQTPVTEQESRTTKDTTTTDDKQVSMVQGEEKSCVVVAEQDALVSKLYEGWIAGRINEANFTRMMEKAQGILWDKMSRGG